MSVKRKILNTFLIVFLVLFVVGAGVFIGFFVQVTKELPDLSAAKDYHPSLITKIYSQEDKVFAEYSIEKRIPISYPNLPENLVHAIVAVEDSRFYQHHGVDFKGIMRAAVQNLLKGRFAQGGSTITQQLARGLFLSKRKTISRKLQEMYISWQLEDIYTKNEILELYFNHIYFGHGAYGVEAASRTYFGKSVTKLTLKECATIAGLPRAPSTYGPIRHPEAAEKRAKTVLYRMRQEKFISKLEYKKALKTPIKIPTRHAKDKLGSYFSEMVRQYLERNYGAERLYREGLQVYTTLKTESQIAAEKAMRNGLRAVDKRQGFRKLTKKQIAHYKKTLKNRNSRLSKRGMLLGTVKNVSAKEAIIELAHGTGILDKKGIKWTRKKKLTDFLKPGQHILVKKRRTKEKGKGDKTLLALEQEPLVEGALVSINPRNGYIESLVGGYDFKVSKFNRAIQARRQAGSAFKPFIYGAALENKFTLGSILMDSPIMYDGGEGVNSWKPTNYHETFSGPTTFRKALEHSKNVVSIKLLRKVGIRKTINLAHRLGIKSKLGHDLSLALGTSELTPIELASAYGVFANNGVRVSPLYIRYIKDKNGHVLEMHKPIKKAVLDVKSNYLMTVLLKGVVEHGTGFRARRLGRPVAGKTGTTNRYKDAWFVGFSPDIVTSVWVGYDRQRTMGSLETGSRAASPIWVDYMEAVLKNKIIKDFPIPDGIVKVCIDANTGMVATKKCTHVLTESFKEESAPKKMCDKHDLSPDRFMEADLDSGGMFEEEQPYKEVVKKQDKRFSPYD